MNRIRAEEAISIIKNNMPTRGTYTILTEALEMSIAALEKRVSMRGIRGNSPVCPSCNEWPLVAFDFCPRCGQKIYWEDKR